MKKAEKIRIGISLGDPNGIGTEVVLKTLSNTELLDLCTPILFGSVKLLSQVKKELGLVVNFNGIDAFAKAQPGKINVFNHYKEHVEIAWGVPTEVSGKFALASFQEGVKALKDGAVDALVTAPINKSNIQSQEFKFPGHTDYLAQELEGEAMMLMVTDTLKVGLLTDHVPVKEVTSHITPELIKKKVVTLYSTLKKDFGITVPKIALLGINPHVGDQGVIGDEDDTVMIPTLEDIRATGKVVYGPYAADSFFGSGNYKNFDGIIAAYHDQGLIPFKTLAFGKGVNYTAGLSHIRTSPDHGTAYEIAGKGQADEGSFREALYRAIDIFKHRSSFEELTKDVLKPLSRKVMSRSGKRQDNRKPSSKENR